MVINNALLACLDIAICILNRYLLVLLSVYLLLTNLIIFQLKIYTMEQSIAAKIDDTYIAKGQSLETLGNFHLGKASNKEGDHVTYYSLSFQIIFPIIMIVFFTLLFFHIVDKFEIYSIRNRLYEKDNKREHHFISAKPSTNNLLITTMALTSFTFVIYVIVLDLIAVSYRHTLVSREIFFNTRDESIVRTALANADISQDPDIDENKQTILTKLIIEYAIPIFILCYDLFILLFLILFVLAIRSGKWTLKWHYILLGPLSCIAVHSYHIILGFIHNPEHAASIAVFYGIVVVLFLAILRVVYVTSYSLVYNCQRRRCYEKTCWNRNYLCCWLPGESEKISDDQKQKSRYIVVYSVLWARYR